MPPNKLRYRKYKSLDKVRFLKDVSNLTEKTNYPESISISFYIEIKNNSRK